MEGRVLLEDLARRLAKGPLPVEEVRGLASVLDALGPEEVIDAVDALVATGMDMKSLKVAISRLLNLLHRSLAALHFEPEDPFFRLLVAENRAALAALDELRAPLASLLAGGGGEGVGRESAIAALSTALQELKALELHYLRKENVLFPYFEARYPRYRCLSLMWSLHDDVREALDEIPRLLEAGSLDLPHINARTGRLFFDLHTLVFREESILFPVISGLLAPREFGTLYREARALGAGLLSELELESLDRNLDAWEGRYGSSLDTEMSDFNASATKDISLDAGSLSPELVDVILKNLPVDITFVDVNDRVRYFSNGKERIFPRSPAIIGRDVRNCHPATSVDKVMAILDAFRKGERSRERFWIERRGRFILIEYRALRDAAGEYLGTLEVSQDLTEERALRGEKRLASF